MKPYKTISDRRMLTGLRIRRERILWGMTQEELAGILGISANYLGQIERGNRDLSRKMEDRLCKLFHLDRNELHSIDNLPGAERLAEDTLFMPQLHEEDIRRMLDSCSPEELQFCGHVLRSMLLFLRHSEVPADLSAAELVQQFCADPVPCQVSVTDMSAYSPQIAAGSFLADSVAEAGPYYEGISCLTSRGSQSQ